MRLLVDEPARMPCARRACRPGGRQAGQSALQAKGYLYKTAVAGEAYFLCKCPFSSGPRSPPHSSVAAPTGGISGEGVAMSAGAL